jgi:hypothetical protein
MSDFRSNAVQALSGGLVFLGLALGVYVVLLIRLTPAPGPAGESTAARHDETRLADRLTEDAWRQCLADIRAAGEPPDARTGGRMTGTPGFYRTGELVADTFRKAGLEVMTQSFRVAVPVTETSEVLDDSGRPLPGVVLYPLMPSGLVPVSMPGELAAEAELIESTAPVDLAGKRIEGRIVICRGFNCNWATLASMGAKAVIVIDDPTENPADPDASRQWSNLVTANDIPFPRFFATGPIDRMAGHPLTVQCKVRWKSVPARNIVGVLRGRFDGTPADEALVISGYTDSSSVVPEQAPGAEQAVQLAGLLELAAAMAPYQGQLQRDVVFIAVGARSQCFAGTHQILRAIDEPNARGKKTPALEEQMEDEVRQADWARQALQLLSTEADLRPPEAESLHRDGIEQPREFQDWVDARFATWMGELNLHHRERYLQARLDWIRAGRPTHAEGAGETSHEDGTSAELHPLMQAYVGTRQADNRSAGLATVPIWTLAHVAPDEFEQWQCRTAFRRYLKEILLAHHETRIRELQSDITIRDLFRAYRATLTVNLELNSGGQQGADDLAVLLGQPAPGAVVEPQSTLLASTIESHVPRDGKRPAFQVTSWGGRDGAGSANDPNIHSWLESNLWFERSRLAYTLVNKTFFPQKIGTPDDTFESLPTDVAPRHVPAIGKALLSIAGGRIPFKQVSFAATPAGRRVGSGSSEYVGRVVTSAGASSLVPSHPMGVGTFVRIYCRSPRVWPSEPLIRGIRSNPIVQTDAYGQYRGYPVTDWVTLHHGGGHFRNTMTVDAANFDTDGSLSYFKDEAMARGGLFDSDDLPPGGSGQGGRDNPINVAVFRCSQVICYDTTNPKTLAPFAGFRILTKDGWVSPAAYRDDATGPFFNTYLPPDSTVYLALMDGSEEHPEVQSPRGFLLNVDLDDVEPDRVEPDLFGRGYLAADTPNIVFPALDGAASVLRTNAKRLRLQVEQRMADEQMLEWQRHGVEWLQEARRIKAEGDTLAAVNAARRAMAFAMNLHPVLREKVAHGVLAVIWYLVLLVPFGFFAERLFFGFTDVRKQLLATGLIFIAVFFLLQFFHPAFRMVRSPGMILLGFITGLLSLLLVVVVVEKFMSAMRQQYRKREFVEGADVNRAGVIGTACLLGLNNMRRRKVRTGLTCGTLILIGFVLISFSSVRNRVVEKEHAIGPAHTNGLLYRDLNFKKIVPEIIESVTMTYGLRYPVTTRYWLVGSGMKNADLPIARVDTAAGPAVRRTAMASGAMVMGHEEPVFSGLDRYLLTNRGWFPGPRYGAEGEPAGIESSEAARSTIILPDDLARSLGLTIDEVNRGHSRVTLRGTTYDVWGIIDAEKLSDHLGMDGQSILPYDISDLAERSGSFVFRSFTIPPDVKRLSGSQVVILNSEPLALSQWDRFFAVSVSVALPSREYRLRPNRPAFPGVTYREQRRVTTDYLERTGREAYYAVDGTAYFGSRKRGRSLAGLLELLVPILIACGTVFNTMRGSVYERRDEIYVYNAVGIAPHHVFFMFMAEACLYAVIGAVAGYVLSIVTGAALTHAGVTRGLNLDYGSIDTIYVSVILVLSVLASTFIPARMAARLALPSEERGWHVPEAKDGVRGFDLPFTFSARDRMAVLSYFFDWLDANGEGSSGRFFCGPPHLRVEQAREGEWIPLVSATVWLKPFDLGVSQQLDIALPTDSQTGEYIARVRIQQLSGHAAAWGRTIRPFLRALRKQFLSWRAISETDRQTLFDEARTRVTNLQEARHA